MFESKAFKDKLPKMLLSGFVYRYTFGSYNATYYGSTLHHFKFKICEHLGISLGKKLKIDSKADSSLPLELF